MKPILSILFAVVVFKGAVDVEVEDTAEVDAVTDVVETGAVVARVVVVAEQPVTNESTVSTNIKAILPNNCNDFPAFI